jgi:hypothetical protein
MVDADVRAGLRTALQRIREVVVVRAGLLFAAEKFEPLALRTCATVV